MSIFAAKPDAGFHIGDIISGQDEGATVQAVVLDKSDTDGAILLMRLPAGDAAEVAAVELTGWCVVPPPEARWVEVYEQGAQEPFFAAYLPNFDAALAVRQAFDNRDGDFQVVIYAASEAEGERLRDLR
jgi:hypothetical protein